MFKLRRNGLDFNKKKNRKSEKIASLLPAIFRGLIACFCGVFFAILFFNMREVNGPSMEPVLESSNRVFINRMTNFLPPKRGDVVAFVQDTYDKNNINIKRIVGIPGDVIQIKDGLLYVNGQKEETETKTETMKHAGTAKNEILLEKGEYFLLGDNRNSSEDSRYQSVGLVKRANILGQVWFCISTSNFGFVS